MNTIIDHKVAYGEPYVSLNGLKIRGDGVAARCCGHLLTQAGYRVSMEKRDRARVPVIMLSVAAQRLIRDIFQRDDLFLDLPVIRKRIVAWGGDAVELDHSAVVVSEEALLDRLGIVSGEAEGAWTIFASAPLPVESAGHRFGSRIASVARVEMKRDDACWIESLGAGWLFLNWGWLLGVGGSIEELLAESRLVRGEVTRLHAVVAKFPASPRMILPLGGPGWIACGSAAMAFDPLCGDGTAHAIREAILASAVVRAADREDVAGLMAHYEGRLMAGFHRHLGECLRFYSSGGSGEWWEQEAAACREGLEWCAERMERVQYRYRLEGLELKGV